METGKAYRVVARWDPEASVWVATSDDVPGLATEADTVEGLIEKLRVMIPELLEANGLLESERTGEVEIPWFLHAERSDTLHA